jgi:hypothetical protein
VLLLLPGSAIRSANLCGRDGEACGALGEDWGLLRSEYCLQMMSIKCWLGPCVPCSWIYVFDSCISTFERLAWPWIGLVAQVLHICD